MVDRIVVNINDRVLKIFDILDQLTSERVYEQTSGAPVSFIICLCISVKKM